MIFSIYQMRVIPEDPEANRQKVKKWIENIMATDKPDTIVLPEMWTTSFILKELHKFADKEGEPTKSFLSKLANEYKVNIIGGSVANKIKDKTYNTSFVFNSKGELVYKYNKIHLVPMLNEQLYLSGGNKKVETFELDGIKMGLIICYDLRFPELVRSLALQGAQILFIVAEWPTSRIYHWRSLQIARAIENQMYVVSSNIIGTIDDVQYGGTSMMIDPGGTLIAEGSEYSESTLSSKLDVEKVSEVRKEIPIFKSRVPNLY